jgi:hydroxyacylglutathione hydrolase
LAVDYGTSTAIVRQPIDQADFPTMSTNSGPFDIVVVPLLKDNYGYLVHARETGETAVVDPSESEPVLVAAKARGWLISHIINTHHHNDHCGGNLGLKRACQPIVIGPAYDRERIPALKVAVDERSGLDFAGQHGQVLFIPGHTKGHIAVFFPQAKALFCGDTLFSIGCGRMFEGTPDQMWSSLKKLRALPDDTWVYCGHEYTQANCRFALTIEPENTALREYAGAVDTARAKGEGTIPAVLGMEKACNPFLRADVPAIAAKFGGAASDPVAAFAAIRQAKDVF